MTKAAGVAGFAKGIDAIRAQKLRRADPEAAICANTGARRLGAKRRWFEKKCRSLPHARMLAETQCVRLDLCRRTFFDGLCFPAQLTLHFADMLRWRDCRAVLFSAPAVVPGARCREVRIGAPAQRNAMDYVAVASDEELRRQKL